MGRPEIYQMGEAGKGTQKAYLTWGGVFWGWREFPEALRLGCVGHKA